MDAINILTIDHEEFFNNEDEDSRSHCLFVTAAGCCDHPMLNFSKYCGVHTFIQYHADKEGCKVGVHIGESFGQTFKLSNWKQCCCNTWHTESNYCRFHRSFGEDESIEEEKKQPIRCQYVVQRGELQGQQCKHDTDGDSTMCKNHMKQAKILALMSR